MNMPYYIKKRIIDIVISTFMLLFLALTLLPIGWMVYSSLKDSTDIAIGKVGMRTAGIDILEIIPQEDNLMVLSADGSLNLIRAKDLTIIKHQSKKTSATSYLVEEDFIWLASANKGLLRVSREDWGKSERYRFPLKKEGRFNNKELFRRYYSKCVHHMGGILKLFRTK